MQTTEIVELKPNRKTRRRLKTRQLLLEAALELVIENGFDATSTEDITEAADIGLRTFYNHFGNKRDCVLTALKERYLQYALEAASIDEHRADPARAVTCSAIAVFNRVLEDPATAQLAGYPRLLAEAIEDSQSELVAVDVAEGLAQDRFKPCIAPQALTTVLLWGFVGLVIDSINRDEREGRGDVWATFVLHNLGLAPDDIARLLSLADSNH